MGQQILKVFAAKDDEVSVAWYINVVITAHFCPDTDYMYSFRLFRRHLENSHFCQSLLRPVLVFIGKTTCCW